MPSPGSRKSAVFLAIILGAAAVYGGTLWKLRCEALAVAEMQARTIATMAAAAMSDPATAPEATLSRLRASDLPRGITFALRPPGPAARPSGQTGVTASHPVAGSGLQLEVDLSPTRVLAQWQRQTLWIGAGIVLTTLCLLALLLRSLTLLERLDQLTRALRGRNRVIQAQAREAELTAQALRENDAKLARQALVLETTLDHMDQGLMMVTADRIVAVCNQRAAAMLDLPGELVSRHPPFADILAFQWQREEFAFSSVDLKDFVRAGGILDQAHSYERKRPDGTLLEVRSVPLAGGGVVRTYTDITARKAYEERLTFIAYHDELTELLNRRAFRKQLEEASSQDSQHGGPAVLYLDLDRFKLVNDTCGHVGGDALLREVARRLTALVRPGDVVARLGGDEFAAMLASPVDEGAAIAVAERARAAISQPFEVVGQSVRVGISIGVALCPRDGVTADTLLRSADAALYRAKAGGRNAVCLHESAAEAEDRSRLLLERDLRLALEREEFELVYQPIFDAFTGLPVSCEALIRWQHPTLGALSPGQFIPVAEATGTIDDIGRWVMVTACAEAATWALPVRIAVNLSSGHLARPDFENDVSRALELSGLPADRLDLEVTETVLITRTPEVRANMTALQRRGVRLVMDDFGTGHASLEALQGLPFQQLKIDRSFVEALPGKAGSGAIVSAILNIAAQMRLEVVAEGVTTVEEADELRKLGCRYLQGFLLAAPQSGSWIRERLWQCSAAGSFETSSMIVKAI